MLSISVLFHSHGNTTSCLIVHVFWDNIILTLSDGVSHILGPIEIYIVITLRWC